MLAPSDKYQYNILLLSAIAFFLGCSITVHYLRVFADTKADETGHGDTENDLSVSDMFEGVDYAVLILSSPDNEEKRNAIRNTWMKLSGDYNEKNEEIQKQQHVKYLFSICTKDIDPKTFEKLEIENSRTNDILFLDSFVESYKYLSLKLQHSLVWINKNMKDIQYVVKCDDDSFVRIDLIVKELEAFAPQMKSSEISEFVSFRKVLPSYKGLYWGYFMGSGDVHPTGKFEEKDWFLCNYYLPYALGGGYVISRGIVKFIGNNHKFLSRYACEDVTMGVWTSLLDGINRVHDTRFDTAMRSRGCNNTMLIRHKQTPQDMYKMYDNLITSEGKRLCDTEVVLKQPYMYNWNVSASLCCRV